MGTPIELAAADGHRFAAYRADPPGTPRGALVVVQAIFGVNSHIRAVADGFAADGYVAIADVRAMQAARPELTFHIYPAGHGFNCDQRGSYHAESAKLARSRTLEFLRKHLG